MEAIPTENSEVDEKGGQVSQYCLRLPPIVRQILENFSSRELLKLSLVNKLWNYEARSLMRDQGNIKAHSSTWGRYGDYENEPCLNFIPFASDLEKMNVVPFTGLHISIDHSDSTVCRSYSIESLHLTYKIILDRLPFKHLTVTFLGNRSKNCATTVMLAQRILEERCDVLEELHLGYSSNEFLQPIFQDRSMPRLKSLTVESSEFDGNLLPSSYLKVLVSRAPNLQELHVDRSVDLSLNLLEGSSAVLVPFKFTVRPLIQTICDGLIAYVRAKSMEILIGEDETDPEELNSLIPQLLEASRTTITSLRMDLLFAVPLMCYGICLENVTELKIAISNSEFLEELEPSMLELPKGLDFTRVFPKLNEVTIDDDDYSLGFPTNVVSAFVEQAKAVLSRALPDRAANIKVLKIHQISDIERFSLGFLAQIFPDVKTLHTKASQRLPFALLREYFLCLEEIEDRTQDDSSL